MVTTWFPRSLNRDNRHSIDCMMGLMPFIGSLSGFYDMAHTHCTGSGTGQGMKNDGFLYNIMYCAHYTGIDTENNC